MSRIKAAQVLKAVLADGKNWEPASVDNQQTASAIKYYVFNVLRHAYFLEHLLNQLVKKSLKPKDFDIKALLLIALYELWQQSAQAHAVVNESVKACLGLKKGWAKGLTNATLRGFERQKEALLATALNEQAQWNHPQWFINTVKAQWPNTWQQLLTANQNHPPMTLRVNASLVGRKAYAKQLDDNGISCALPEDYPQAICLNQAVAIKDLPGFEQGTVSVQDLSAQKAAALLQLQPNLKVLDACAAPGGKTAHMLELEPSLDVTAIDMSAHRTQMLEHTLSRLKLKAKVLTADASQPNTWWDKQLFDRILLDAPCTGSGVIKRHPDIKFKLNQAYIDSVIKQQAQLLEALWPLLAPKGILVYATCSILKQENSNQVEAFINRHEDAVRVLIDDKPDLQIETCDAQDGFYYAIIQKSE